ncbi:RDD family protein [Microbacterium sp. LMI1-1-1.1]|uniref:RDD family protein n=1 Tax=Microbacterium sp. LMI1-1-1.1 TaxID=3135223 RepID=UPI003466586B
MASSHPTPVSPAPAAGAAVVEIAQDETLTGEAVALDVQPVGFFLRIVGALIDLVVSVLVLIAGSFLAGWLLQSGVVDAAALPIVSVVLVVTVLVVVPTAVETLSRGRSLGKLAVGGRIVRLDGGTSGFRQALIRAVAGVFEIWFTLGTVAALVGIFTPRAQRLGDLLAGTASERTRTRPLPSPAPGLPAGLEDWARSADVSRLPDRLGARVGQFVRTADALDPASRLRVATGLAEAVAPYVAPRPPVDAETLVRAVAAVRRDREYRALVWERERAASLTADR